MLLETIINRTNHFHYFKNIYHYIIDCGVMYLLIYYRCIANNFSIY